jgi:hypothetical protein
MNRAPLAACAVVWLLVGSVAAQMVNHNVPLGQSLPETSTTPKIILDVVAISSAQPGVPCFNCVNGTTAGTFGFASPFGYVALSDTNDQLIIYYTDTNCPIQAFVTFKIVQGTNTQVLQRGMVQGFTANSVGYVTRNQSIPPNSPSWSDLGFVAGPATLVGAILCQGQTPPNQLRAPIFFH